MSTISEYFNDYIPTSLPGIVVEPFSIRDLAADYRFNQCLGFNLAPYN
nr:MAG TPA: hypothetical protein [Caudoviricetes sp.]